MDLYSIKMRASRQGAHISGAENIISKEQIPCYAQRLVDRGMNHAKGEADFVNLKIERIDEREVIYLDALCVETLDVADYSEGIAKIREFLCGLGVKEPDKVLNLFEKTYEMRGAMLLDIHTLERLEPDKGRGVRATYMDMEKAYNTGNECGGCKNPQSSKNHFMEALVLATKVANTPGIVGEICISDDPGYVTGYVASKENGYRRITRLKPMGSELGGRIFLFDSNLADPKDAIAFLEKQRVIVRNVRMTQEIRQSVIDVNNIAISDMTEKKAEGKLEFVDRELERLKKEHLYRSTKTLTSMQGAYVTHEGRSVMMLASNSYLDMISSREVIEYAKNILSIYGAGSGGSRLTTGNTDIHDMLEKKLAEFKRTEAAVVFDSGYVANLATVSAFADRSSVIFSDELNHASIIDGCRLSRAKIVVYKHNDMQDLEEKIKENYPCRGMMVSDAVFSMDGDILRLPEFVELGRKYSLITMIDEAHSTGVIGESGHGIMEYYGYCCDAPDIIMGTLSKAVGSEGGFVCAKRNVVEYLINKARGYIFSTSLSPVTMAASYKGICMIDEHPEMIRKLRENVRFFCECLKKEGIDAYSETAIVPIIIGDEEEALKCQELLLEKGYYISAIRYPTVAKNTARLRAALMASHSFESLEGSAGAVAAALRHAQDDIR